MLRSLANDLLNSLSAHIAVLDSDGIIVAVNDAWRRFASASGGDGEAAYVGVSYLDVCADAVRRNGDEVAEAVLGAIRGLQRGERDSFALEYPCHSAEQRRWFIARITRFQHDGVMYIALVHEDITPRKLAEEARERTERTLRNVLGALPVGVWIMERTGRIVEVNPAGERIWGGARYVGPEQFGEYKAWWQSSGEPIAADEWAAARAIRKGETSIDEEIRIECFDGSEKIILNSAVPLRDDAGEIQGAIIVNQDITARKGVEEELRRANAAIDAANRDLQEVLQREQIRARTDELTGLCNRRAFFNLSRQLFSVAKRYATPLSVVMFDLDRFKQINDELGHQAGDEALRRVAHVLRQHTRHADVLARYGGEEFIVALPNTTVEQALAMAEIIRRAVAAEPAEADGGVCVTISAGVAGTMPDDPDLEAAIRRADEALYTAKEEGRNCIRVLAADGA